MCTGVTMNNTLLTINIDYHHTPLGLTQQDMALVHGLGFSIDSIVRYFYNLYSMGFLNQYQSKQDVLNELATYSPIFNLTDNEYELDMFRIYLYTDEIKKLDQAVQVATDLDSFAQAKSKYDYVANLIQTKGKYIDVLCKVFVSLNNYILSHSQYYIKPLNDFSAKTRIPLQYLKPGNVNICGGWIVVEFVQGQ